MIGGVLTYLDEREGEMTSQNWKDFCAVCGQRPTVGKTGLCGPCCFGEADTVGGNF